VNADETQQWTGVSIAVRMDRFFGNVSIDSEAILFEPAGAGNALSPAPAPHVTHRERQVVFVVGRLALPWMNTGLVLVDPALPNGWTAVALLPSWQRRSMVSHLRECGYAVDVVTTWLSTGGQVGSVRDLQRLLADRA
jgi:hypothetical protein